MNFEGKYERLFNVKRTYRVIHFRPPPLLLLPDFRLRVVELKSVGTCRGAGSQGDCSISHRLLKREHMDQGALDLIFPAAATSILPLITAVTIHRSPSILAAIVQDYSPL
jgi:hypothetical protein